VRAGLVDELDQRGDLVARHLLGELRMIDADVLEGAFDDLVLGVTADDLAALACDLPGHGVLSRAIVGDGGLAYVAAKVGATLEGTHVQLCGRLVVELRGVRVEQRLPSRQGRILFAYLALQRPRSVARDELIEAIWGGSAPADHAKALTVLLSKLRAVLGPDVLVGRGDVRLELPPGARVDAEQAILAAHRAESAMVQEDWVRAWSASLCAQYIAARPLLSDVCELPWLDEWRRRLGDALDRSLEVYAAACLALGGTELGGAERAARRLVQRNPLSETGYGLLMRAVAARGRVPEALGVYEQARTVLRDELGIPPSAAIAQLHAQLLADRELTRR
jgi:DNA-binding SARP family transcriptional activator